LITSNFMPIQLQNTDNTGKGVAGLRVVVLPDYEGKRAIHKDTGELCTVIKAQEVQGVGTRYTVHFDKHPKNLLQVVWTDGLVILGEVHG
jgi:hypothetical protein